MNALTTRQDFARSRALPAPAQDPTGSKHPGILRRIYEAIVQARQRQAERDIVRLLGQSGGHLTDEVERRITEHLTRNRNFRP